MSSCRGGGTKVPCSVCCGQLQKGGWRVCGDDTMEGAMRGVSCAVGMALRASAPSFFGVW